MKVDLARLLAEIKRRPRIMLSSGADPVAAIMRYVSRSPNSPANRRLVKIAAAVVRRRSNFDENEVWSLGEESLGLLDALIERTIS